MSGKLEGKVVVITGGASGIGLATAQLFAAESARVVIFDIDAEAAAQAIETIKGNYPASRLIVDVSNARNVEAAFMEVVAANGRLDILVNVAGGSGRRWGDAPTDSCTIEGWNQTLSLNLDSVFYCCKYGLQAMLTQRRGVIVNVSSILGLVGGDEDFATHAYAASKGAVISLTRSIASYYATYGIRANVICPGLIATPMSKRAQESKAIRDRLVQLQPLTADFGSPHDIANAALYLASEASSFVTGTILTVDGGWTMR
jgi:NAD(P)-dependent dehydrogenase (short-subunit alcohol dehydrogenase family)